MNSEIPQSKKQIFHIGLWAILHIALIVAVVLAYPWKIDKSLYSVLPKSDISQEFQNAESEFSSRSATQLLLFVGDSEEDEAEEEEYRKAGDGDVDRAAGKLDPRYNGGAEEGCAFAENIVDAEIFAGIFGGNDLGVIGARKRLYGALEAADAERQYPEMKQRSERERVETYAEVADNAGEDELHGIVLL